MKFKKGDRVVFIDPSKTFKKGTWNLYGKTGIVRSSIGNNVEWEVDGTDGDYWDSDPNQLELCKTGFVKQIVNDLLDK